MKIIMILTVVLAQSNVLFAQQEPTTTSSDKRLSYRLSFSPELQYRTIVPNANETWLVESRNDNEIAHVGFSAGISAEYSFVDNVRFSAGVEYADRGYRSKPTTTTNQSQPPTQSYAAYHFRYIDIPLSIGYDFFHQSKWTLVAAGGVTPSIFIQRSKTLVLNSQNTSSSTENVRSIGYDRFALFLHLAIASEYALTDNWVIRLGAGGKRALSALNANVATKEYLFSGGLELGLVWKP